MAEKKLTKAQQAAEPKSRRSKTTVEVVPAKEPPAEKPARARKLQVFENDPRAGIAREAAFPLRYVAAVITGVILLAFVSVLLTGEGAVLKFLVDVFCGLFGRKCYYMSMVTMAVLLVILVFSTGKRVRGRTVTLMGLTFLFGCMAHILSNPAMSPEGIPTLKELYTTGLLGTSGGIVCGYVAEMLVMAFGRFFTLMAMLIMSFLSVLTVAQLGIRDVWHWLLRVFGNARAQYAQHRPEPQYTDFNQEEQDKLSVPQWVKNLFPNRNMVQRVKDRLYELSEPVDDEEYEEECDEADFGESFPEEEPEAPAEPVNVLPEEFEVAAQVAAEPGSVPARQKVTAQEAAEQAAQVEQEIAAAQKIEKPEYKFPPINLLHKPMGRAADGTAEMKENTRRLNETLESFKIDAHISNVTRGPSVTRYEVELQKGVRLNKLTTCADDIALSLGASGVRIAPVPGKISVVGIEVPNQAVTNVSLREVIDSPEFSKAKSKSSIAVGKDIGGSCIIGNIAKFPHMLIAGTTGSGKSVCMNSIIISLLYKSSPEDVKLIMVDPKMVELGIYNGIPHLLIPVVTDPKKAAGSLQWAVTEMLRRYRSMSDAGVRDLESYNAMIEGGEIEGEKLPQVVVIIDELADLMLVAAKEVEESICRIAQMGRAAGIHLIIATQRPSADVITGLMKANIPSRIAFSVASAMESRIILDTQGAEKLVGKGDMLYSPIGSGKPQRVQGCFVTDPEVEAVAEYVKANYAATYDQSVMEDIERKAEHTGSKSTPPTASDPDPTEAETAGDEMLPQAVEVILETKQASVSMLQRRLKLGYARAARIVDEMEEKGIVGPFMGSKPRQILITREQWEQMKLGQTIVTEPAVEEEIDIPF